MGIPYGKGDGGAMLLVQGDQDLGIPLGGSDPVRRRRIKAEINQLKGYLLLYRIDERWMLSKRGKSFELVGIQPWSAVNLFAEASLSLLPAHCSKK
jgi:hypothetical protein